MTYLESRNKRSGAGRAIGWSLLVAVVLMAIIHFFMPHFFPGIFTTIARPFWRMEFSFQSGSIRSPSALLEENEALKRTIMENEVRLQSVTALEAENAELKSVLGRNVPSPASASTTASSTVVVSASAIPDGYTLSAILKRPPATAYDEFIIDVGNDHNLSVSKKVYAPGNVLIGHVSQVLDDTATVILYSSPGEKYEVLVGVERAPATATGRGGGQYKTELPRDVTVKEGDFVINPSLNDRPFGIVTAVLADPAEPFQTVLFAPPVNIYELRWVLIAP